MTLPSVTLFPQALLPLLIFEPRYRKMLKSVLQGSRIFAVAMQKPKAMREAPVSGRLVHPYFRASDSLFFFAT